MIVFVWIAVWFASLFGIVYGIVGGPEAMASPQFILGVIGALVCAVAFFWLFGSYAGTPRPNRSQANEPREEPVEIPNPPAAAETAENSTVLPNPKPQAKPPRVPKAKPAAKPAEKTTSALEQKAKPKTEPVEEIKSQPKSKPKSDTAPQTPNGPAYIQTRTGVNDTGKRLVDRYDGVERPFTITEDSQILTSYEAGFTLFNIAEEFGIDQRQIAIRLTRLLLDPKDAINDEVAATSNRARYAAGEKDQIELEYLEGLSVDEIASRHGRTVLAIGWLLLERPGRPLVQPGRSD